MDYWSGVYCSDGCALLVFIPLKGYYSISSFKWMLGDIVLGGEDTPLLYCGACGIYKCTITINGSAVASRMFNISLS